MNLQDVKMPYYKRNDKEQLVSDTNDDIQLPSLAFMTKMNAFYAGIQRLEQNKEQNN